MTEQINRLQHGRGAGAARRAFTLVETLVVMTILAAILGTVVMTIYALQRSSRGMTEGLANTVQQQRFAAQLRTDAHAAQGADLTTAEGQSHRHSASTLLTLDMGDGQEIQYSLGPGEIERQVRVGQSIAHRESYFVSALLETGWTIDRERARPMLTVLLHQHPNLQVDPAAKLRSMRIDAAVGLERPNEANGSP